MSTRTWQSIGWVCRVDVVCHRPTTLAAADSAFGAELYRRSCICTRAGVEVHSFHPALRLSFSVRVRHEVVQVAVVIAASNRTHGDAAIRNPVFCDRYPTRTCVAGSGGVRSSGDKCILHPNQFDAAGRTPGMATAPRGDVATASTKAVGGSDCVAWLTYVNR
jgi:hypothetical protein